MKEFFILFSIGLMLLINPIKSGHIFSQPSELIPQNQKYVSTIHLFFSLETSLVVGDYLVLKFPFNVGFPTASISISMDIKGQALFNLIRTSGTDPEHYFQLSNQLTAGTWYRLQVNIAQNSLGSQTGGPQGCVNMQSASSSTNDRIIYDSNLCLDYISFGPVVDTTIFKVFGSHTYTQANVILNFGQSYTVFFDVFPNVEVEEGAVIVLSIAGTSFSFGSSCVSISCLIGSTNPDCPTNYNYNMTVMPGNCISNGQTLTFTLDKKVTINPFRIQAMIINPNGVASSSVTAIYKSKKAETWFATAPVLGNVVNPLSLSTSYPSISATSTVQLFWGLQSASSLTGTNFLGCPITLYRVFSTTGTNAPGTLRVLNSVKTTVSISTTINSFRALQFISIIWTPVDISTGVVILLSTVQSTFPVVSGTTSKCIGFSTNGVNCNNIDSMTIGSSYVISAKVILNPATAASPPTTATCGKVEFYRGNDVTTNRIGMSSTQTIPVRDNYEYIDNNVAAVTTNGFHQVGGFGSITGYNVFASYLFSTNNGINLKKSNLKSTDGAGPTASPAGSKGRKYALVADLVPIYNTIARKFYAGTADGTPGVFIRPSTSATSDNYGLFMLITTNTPTAQGPTDICNPDLLGIWVATQQLTCFPDAKGAAPLATAANAKVVWVMLKLVFNNFVLNINSGDFSKGVVIVGTLFGVLSTDALAAADTVLGHTLPAAATPNSLDLTATSLTISDYEENPSRNFISQQNNLFHVTIICQPYKYCPTAPVAPATVGVCTDATYLYLTNCGNIGRTDGIGATVAVATATSGLTVAATGTSGLSGISFLKTNINTYPSQYVDSYVFDFILCFKCIIGQSTASASGWDGATLDELKWTLTETFGTTAGAAGVTQAGPGLFNAYVLSSNNGVVSNYKATASFVNYYTTTAVADTDPVWVSTGNAFASYIRVVANFGVGDLSSAGSQVSIFLDGEPVTIGLTNFGQTYDGLSSYMLPNSNNNVNIIDHTTGVSSLATIFRGYDEPRINQIAATARLLTEIRWLNHLWFSKSGFTYSSIIPNTNGVVNAYIPVKSTLRSLTSVHIVIKGSTNVLTGISPIIGVFRVFGANYKSYRKRTAVWTNLQATANTGNAAGAVAPATAPPGATSLDAFPDDIASSKFLSTGYWNSGLAAGDANTCVNSVATGSIKTSIVKTSASGDILPSKTYSSGIAFSAYLLNPSGTSCLVNKGGDLVSDFTESSDLGSGTAGSNIGSAFITYSRDVSNIFNTASTLTWSGGGSTNKCIFHNIPFSATGSTVTYYTIFCQADKISSGTGDAGYGSNTNQVVLGTFTVPFYWGKDFNIGNRLQYAWSNWLGYGVYAAKDSASTQDWIKQDCVTSVNTGIPKDTMDVSYTLSLTNQVSYILETFNTAGDSVVVEEEFSNALTAGTTSSVNFAACEFPNNANIQCSNSNAQSTYYTLRNINTVSKVSLTSISISVIIDTQGQTINSHWARIKYNGATIEYCSYNSATSFNVDGTKGLGVITFGSSSDFKYTNMKSARGSFYFTFSFARIIRASNVFTFNLGFFSNPTQGGNNFRCMILNSNGLVSNNFLSLTITDMTKSYVTVKTTMISGGNFRYLCLGGQTTDYTSSTTEPIRATYGRSGVGAASSIATTINPITPGLIPPDAVSINSVTLTKLFKTKGFDAEYIISFLPSSTNITLAGRIIVEFPICVPPKLNYAGTLDCYLNENPVFCEFIEERRISIWPNIVLYKTSNAPYVIRIPQVTQPHYLDVIQNPLIYLALDDDQNTFNTIAEQAFVSDTFDTSPNMPAIIYLHDFAFSQNKIRSTTSISVVVNMPANSILLGSYIYVQLPASFENSLFYNPTGSCSLRRINDNSNNDFVRSCNLVRGRKFVIFVNTDTINNVELNYTLTISNILTPQQASSTTNFFREDVRVFVSPDNQTVTATSAPGNRNTTVYLNWIIDSSKVLVQWLNSNGGSLGSFLDVNIGNYKVKPAISATNGNFNNTYTWQFSGSNSSNFVTQQKNGNVAGTLNIRSGYSSSSFFIGAKENLPPGKYYLSTIASGDTYNAYSPLPYLDIRAVSQPCVIVPSVLTLTIPAGGYSIPIVLDFNDCPPLTDVTVLANLTTGADKYLTFSNSQTSHSQNLKFDSISSNYRLYYYLNSGNPFGNLTSGAATIGFSLTGTNAPHFSISSSIIVTIIAPITEIPVMQAITIANSPGSLSLSFACTQTGNIYYAFGLKTSILASTYSLIKVQSQDKLLAMTNPDENDENYKVYGYIPYIQSNVYTTLTFSNIIKAGDNYTAIAFCVNQNSLPSNNSATITWIQPDNGGKTVAINLVFKNQDITPAQKLEIACGFARFFAIPPKRVKTDEGYSCTTLRLLQSTVVNPASNTSNITNVTTYYSYNWFVIKDYFTNQDNLYQDVQTKLRDPGFVNNVFTLTSLGINGFPQVNATSTAVIDSYSVLGSTVPNLVASTEIANWFSIGISITLTNIDGYIYCGVGSVNSTAPTLTQLRLGLDGSNSALLNRKYNFQSNNTVAKFNFTNLQNNTNYTLYWGANNLDTSINAIGSVVSSRMVMTTPPPWQGASMLGYSVVMIVLVLTLINLMG